jgi:hypothetical protein
VEVPFTWKVMEPLSIPKQTGLLVSGGSTTLDWA